MIHATLGDNVTMFCVFDVGGSSTGLLDVSTARLYQVIHATLGDNVTMFSVFDVGGSSTGLLDVSTARLLSDTCYTGRSCYHVLCV